MEAMVVCAVVVTFHPDDEVFENLSKLCGQVDGLVVVDNGSGADAVERLRRFVDEARPELGIGLVENGENLGIARALNVGVQWAQSRGFRWVMLFDQDSAVTDGYVETMSRCFAASGLGERLAILVPRYVDRRFGSVLEAPRGGGAGLEAATTSGSLMPMEVFERAGWFAEELFIDGVDYEYSLRVRRLGYGIEECVEAVLLHSPGTPTHHQILGSKAFQAANYSPLRRYYQERNKVWVFCRYWRSFPGFCMKQWVISLKDLLKILLVEEDKVRKCRFFLRGVWDGLRGRMGRLEVG